MVDVLNSILPLLITEPADEYHCRSKENLSSHQLGDLRKCPYTGESVPVPKQTGDPVYAGTINGDGLLTIQSTKIAADSSLARIVHMVQDAQSKRAPSEQWVEHFAQIYTPAVMLLALSVFIVPPAFFHQNWTDWFYRGLVLLVIGCPCALVISTPVSIVAALTAAAKNGILIKGGSFVEIPSQLKAIALDKTGTLTRGKPAVVEVVPLAGILIYTAASDSEGTLGGLVHLGQPVTLGRQLQHALEAMRICGSDPLCAEHPPQQDGRCLHGACCHACLFAPETSCEKGNRFLDRSTLVSTFAEKCVEFFKGH